MGPQHTSGAFPTVRIDFMKIIDWLKGGEKPVSTPHPTPPTGEPGSFPGGPQTPVPQFFTDVGDLTWIMGLIDWLVSRAIIPDWVAALVKFTLSMFVPATRGRSDNQRNIDDLHKSWDQFVTTHPMAVPYSTAARSMPGTIQKE